MNNFNRYKSQLDANLARGRWNYVRMMRATRIEYSDENKSAIDLIHWGTTIQRWFPNGDIEIMSEHNSITTRQRHNHYLPHRSFSDKGNQFISMTGGYSERKTATGIYRNILIPMQCGTIAYSERLEPFLKSEEAFLLNLGMRAGNVDACDRFAEKIVEYGYPHFAEIIRGWRGEKFGWDRRKVKKELDALDEAHFDICEYCNGRGRNRSYNYNTGKYDDEECSECKGEGRFYSHLWLWDFETLNLERPLTNRDVLYKRANPDSDEATIDCRRYAISLADGNSAKPSPNDEFIEKWLDKHSWEEAQKAQIRIPGV